MSVQTLLEYQQALRDCRRCADMLGPVVIGPALLSPIMQIGQAPGAREGELGRPFAWTAGKTLFGWYERLGVNEQQVRERVYMAAVCRCFPGKKARGGDRVPGRDEIVNCAPWLEKEARLLRPKLLIPVGKLAIEQLLSFNRLSDVIGQQHRLTWHGLDLDVVPLPHPSGVSTWHRLEPGKTLLQDALQLIGRHPTWRSVFAH